MRPARCPVAALLAPALLAAGCGLATPEASLIVAGGDIVTLDPDRPRARALAVRGERILAVGDETEIARYRGRETVELALAGRAVVPGFVDHHVHLLNLGLSLLNAAEGERLFIDLSGLDRERIAARIAERAATTPRGTWILGKGWSQGAWGETALPSHEILTAAAPEHPVFLSRVDGHAGWVNAAALAAAGIDAQTPDPPGGAFLRSADGAPTGLLLERANEPVQELLPALTDPDVMRAFRLATEALARQGVVAAFDAGFLPMPGVVGLGLDLGRYLDLLGDTDELAPLPIDVNVMLPAPSHLAVEALAAPEEFRRLSPRLAVTHLKLFADGALGSRGGALTRPYADDPATRGVPRMTRAEIHRWSAEALAAGFDVAVHAIGDAAVRDALAVFGELLAAQPDLDPGRLRIEHFSFAARDDLELAARLGVVLSVQPGFVAPGDDGLAMEDARIGSPDSERVYAFGSLEALGARLAFGSDLFTAPGAPLATFHSAVTRQNANGRPPDGWHPAERLARYDALRLSTTLQPAGGGPPRAAVLAAGAPATFVILSADPLAAPADQLLSTAVEVVVKRGKIR